MDLRKLKTLIDLVSESNISELEITEAEGKVRIVKAGAAAVVAAPVYAPAPAPAAAAPAGPAAPA
ncbi:acetyl-CoA carboxylase biotin carboxyl carrier protein subunit, partial [beta proteobacterium AAP51]